MRLAVHGLRHRFAGTDVAAAPMLDIAAINAVPGEVLLISGPSGSGKSTLLYLLSGLLKPSEGEVVWGDMDLARLGEDARDSWRRQNCGFVFQNFYLISEMTPLQNVVLAAYFTGWSAARYLDRARHLLAEFGVPDTARHADTLSRGEQQRVALARALLFEPPILFADEPTASLDAENGKQIAGLLGDLARNRNMAVIVVSHDPDLMDVADRVIRLEHGRIAAPAIGHAP